MWVPLLSHGPNKRAWPANLKKQFRRCPTGRSAATRRRPAAPATPRRTLLPARAGETTTNCYGMSCRGGGGRRPRPARATARRSCTARATARIGRDAAREAKVKWETTRGRDAAARPSPVPAARDAGAEVKYRGVRWRPSGRYAAEIRDPARKILAWHLGLCPGRRAGLRG